MMLKYCFTWRENVLSAKKKLARVEEGQRHLDKKMGAVEKKLEIIHEAVKQLAPK